MPEEYVHVGIRGWNSREKGILIFLSYLPCGCDIEFLAFCLNAVNDDIEKNIRRLSQDNAVRKDGDHYLINIALTNAQIRAMTGETKGSSPDMPGILFAYHRQQYDLFYEASFAFFQDTLEKLEFAHAQKIYDIFRQLYRQMRPDIRNEKACRAFVNASVRFLRKTRDFVWSMRQTHVWCIKCRALAQAIHGEDLVFTVNAIHIFVCVSNYSLNINRFHSLARWEDIPVKDCDEMQLNTFIQIECFSAFLAGYYNKAINCAYNNVYAENSENHKSFGRVLHSYSAFSAMMLGEYDVALDILKNGLIIASQSNLVVYVTLFQAFTAFILLLKNEDDKARDMLNKILEDNNYSVYIGGVVWASRLLAYYYYKQGDIARSYEVYADLQARAEKVGFEHGSYLTASFVLELLTEYNLAGYPSPSKYSIEDEINLLLQSPAPSLRACALRCRARIKARGASRRQAEAQADVREALRIFRELRTPVELLKTLLVSVEILVGNQKDTEAIALLRENLDIAKRYGFNIATPPIQRFIEKHKEQIGVTDTAQDRTEAMDSEGMHIYHSEKMHDLYNKAAILADKDTPVFIFGESGVGKEHIARTLHEKSRRKGDFVAVNLSSIPEHLFESEFFGYEKGAFTGAANRKIGLLELADQGTLFLDEVVDIPSHIQVKLLRILQEKTFMRVGGTKLLQARFRLVTASNKSLSQAVVEGIFREDLFYRINVVSLHVPPLRERENDILFISEYYLNFFCRKYLCTPRKFSYDDIMFFMSYSWPGNIRELRNYIERFVLSFIAGSISPAGEAAKKEQEKRGQTKKNSVNPVPASRSRNIFMQYGPECFGDSLPSLEEVKNQYVEFVYQLKNGKVAGPRNIEQTLKVGKVTAYRWIDKLKLRERYVTRLHDVSPLPED